jgi:hypothetical protein
MIMARKSNNLKTMEKQQLEDKGKQELKSRKK